MVFTGTEFERSKNDVLIQSSMTYVCCVVPYIDISVVKSREYPWVLDGIGGESMSGLITEFRYLFLAVLDRSNDSDRR